MESVNNGDPWDCTNARTTRDTAGAAIAAVMKFAVCDTTPLEDDLRPLTTGY